MCKKVLKIYLHNYLSFICIYIVILFHVSFYGFFIVLFKPYVCGVLCVVFRVLCKRIVILCPGCHFLMPQSQVIRQTDNKINNLQTIFHREMSTANIP